MTRFKLAITLFAGEDGGADRNRTGDLRRAKPALSQLSYSPNPIRDNSKFPSGNLGGGPKWI